MAKSSEISFWTSSTPPESWEDLLEYTRPRSKAELHELFDLKPPQLPDPSEPPMQEEPPREPTLLEQLRLKPDEFVELALQQPNLWTEDELDYLNLVAYEGEIDERLDELAKEYFTGDRQRQEEPGDPTPPPAPAALDTSVDLPDLPGTTTIPDLDVLEGTADVDRWWEKQKR